MEWEKTIALLLAGTALATTSPALGAMRSPKHFHGDYYVEAMRAIGTARSDVRLTVPVDLLLAFCLSANAVETATQRCEQATNVDTAIEACSSIIQTDKDRHRLATAYFNRAGSHLKKDATDRAVSDLNEAIRFEPDFAAALTKRDSVEERFNDLRSARADFAAVLKLPTTNNLSVWAMQWLASALPRRKRLPRRLGFEPSSRGSEARSACLRLLEETACAGLQECNAKPSAAIKLPGAKGAIELNKCYRGREHMSCVVAALLAEANSIKQDYAEIVSAGYPTLKTLDSICQIAPDQLSEHAKALQIFRERWSLLRKEYAARLECTNSVEDALRNLSLADMSYGADLVKSMVEFFATSWP